MLAAHCRETQLKHDVRHRRSAGVVGEDRDGEAGPSYQTKDAFKEILATRRCVRILCPNATMRKHVQDDLGHALVNLWGIANLPHDKGMTRIQTPGWR